MMTRQSTLLLAAVVLALGLVPALPHRARADAQQQQSFSAWRQMQECARQATKKFPDHTPQGNAQREAARQDCLRQQHLPVSAPPPGH
jgi:ABC-type sugar transport system substrate-binding protein